MNVTYLVLGVLLLAVSITDLLWTTLWIEGSAGPLTTRLMRRTWQVIRGAASGNSRVRSLSGPFILVLSLAVWFALIWAGWTLVFASSESALIDTRNPGPISWSERIYFTGYTIFTLGNGDFAPRDGVWQLATALATASGMLFVTMSVTYVLSVLDAVSQKRAFANDVIGLGMQGGEIVRTGWNGENLRNLDLPLNTVASELNSLLSNHQAYPILHYFHSAEDENSAVIAIPILDETLTVLKFGIPAEIRPNMAVVDNARSGIESYVETLDVPTQRADEAPDPPDLSLLRDAGISTVSDDEFRTALSDLETRRRKLRAVVEADAREWPRPTDE